jgi:hypothetical protein
VEVKDNRDWWILFHDIDNKDMVDVVPQSGAHDVCYDWTELGDGEIQFPTNAERDIYAYEQPLFDDELKPLQGVLNDILPCVIGQMIIEYVYLPKENCLIELLVELMKTSPHWILEMYFICEFSEELARVYPNDKFRYELTEKEQKEARVWLQTAIKSFKIGLRLIDSAT